MKTGRNDPCPCGSDRKFKHCCGQVAAAATSRTGPAAERAGAADIGALVRLIELNRLQDAEDQAVARLKAQPNAPMLWKILSVALLRQGKEALQALQRAAELLPQDAEVHGNLGAFLCERGQWAQGLERLQRALEIQPRNEQLLLDTADAARAVGRLNDSIALYERALQVNPRSAEAHNNQGNALLQLGQCEEALRCYRSALELRPNEADILCNIGNAQRQLGRLAEALESSQRAIALDPSLSVAHNNLGLVLAGLGRRAEAERSYRQALSLNPGYVEALNNLAAVLPELGQRREALSLYARAIELDPKRADSFVNRGNLSFEFRRVDDAALNYRRALELEPRNVAAHAGLGAALRMQGQAAEAEQSCRSALEIDPKCVAALSLLGELRADRGDFVGAEKFFTQAMTLDPGFPFAYYSIATNRRMTREDTAWLAGIEGLLATPLPLRHEISLRYALGKYYDDIKQYDDAFGQYAQANELTKRYGAQYDRAGLAARVDRVIESFGARALRELQSLGHASERPVFIVGMPRSGTSLSEQILATHPAVFGAGELPFWQAALAAYETAGFGTPAATQLIPGMASGYLARLGGLSSDARRVVDKMPLNFMSVGLIHAAFPQARILHVRRHPIDTSLSIYFQYFSHLHAYANDLEHLAHYYGQYVRLMDHWHATLPADRLLEVPYEGLIEDQEGWSRRMLEFIGLPWDPKCLDFHQTDRVVITLSKWQVRQKIHSASAGRWRNYEKHLGPLRALLNADAQPAGARVPAG